MLEKRDQSSPKRKPSALAPPNSRPHRSFVESGVTKLVARSYDLARCSTRVKHAKSLLEFTAARSAFALDHFETERRT
jgi:hypothetical protein